MWQLILAFLLMSSSVASAQTFRVFNEAQHPLRHKANRIIVDTDPMNGNLFGIANDLQSQLEAIDQLSLSGGSGGSCWELDGNNDLEPVSGSCIDTLWEQDGSGDLEPKT